MPIEKARTFAPELRFWGVRGSYPATGAEFAGYGGATACIEVRNKGARFVVDAGTGIIGLGKEADWARFDEIHLLLTHLHHDHIIGLPFFKPLHRKNATLHIWLGNLDGQCATEALNRMFAPPLFPFSLDQVPAKVVCHGFRAGETIHVQGQDIPTVRLNHPSGATGYRFDDEHGSAAIITDIEHGEAGACPMVAAACRGVDTLVYDTMMQDSEYGECRGWGHSTIAEALKLKEAAGARRLVGFHHAPHHTDAVMAARELELDARAPGSLMAREGLVLACAAPTVD